MLPLFIRHTSRHTRWTTQPRPRHLFGLRVHQLVIVTNNLDGAHPFKLLKPFVVILVVLRLNRNALTVDVIDAVTCSQVLLILV